MIRLRCPSPPVRSLTFSPDGDLLAGAGPEEVWCWCASRGWELSGLRLARRVDAVAVAFHPAGQTLAYVAPQALAAPGWWARLRADFTLDTPAVHLHPLAEDGVVEPAVLPLWNPSNQEASGWRPGLAFTPDGGTIISNTFEAPSLFRSPRHTILQWRLTGTGPRLAENPEPTRTRTGTEDGSYRLGTLFVMVGGFGMRGCPFDPGDRRPIVVPRLGDAKTLAVAPVGELVASATHTGVFVWHLRTQAPVAFLPRPPGLAGWVSGAAEALGFSPDGAVLAVGGGDAVTIWNPVSGDRAKSFDFGVDTVTSVAYSPDGLLLAVGGERGVVVVDVD